MNEQTPVEDEAVGGKNKTGSQTKMEREEERGDKKQKQNVLFAVSCLGFSCLWLCLWLVLACLVSSYFGFVLSCLENPRPPPPPPPPPPSLFP